MNLNIEILTLFELIKKRAKKNYFSSLILKHKINIKKPGILLMRQQEKRNVMTKKFIQKCLIS